MTKQLLSPRDLARAIGVSESSIKRWTDEGRIRATRTVGRHRRIPIAEAVRFVRESGSILVEPGALGLEALAPSPSPGAQDEGDQLLAYLELGAAEEGRGFLTLLYLQGWSVAELADGPIRHAFHRLGELWRDGDAGIFIEHRATEITVRALCQLSQLLPPPAEGPTAVGGAPPSDPYLLPTLLAAMVLGEAGYRTVNLGPETPLHVLVEAAEQLEAGLVWVSIGRAAPGAALEALLPGLEAVDAFGVLGGRGLDPSALAAHPRLLYGASMSELERIGRDLRTVITRRPRPGRRPSSGDG